MLRHSVRGGCSTGAVTACGSRTPAACRVCQRHCGFSSSSRLHFSSHSSGFSSCSVGFSSCNLCLGCETRWCLLYTCVAVVLFDESDMLELHCMAAVGGWLGEPTTCVCAILIPPPVARGTWVTSMPGMRHRGRSGCFSSMLCALGRTALVGHCTLCNAVTAPRLQGVCRFHGECRWS